MKVIFWARGLALFSLLAFGGALAADGGHNPLAEHVRDANSRFKDVKVAVAEGYAPIPCTSGIDGGAMGVHYVNGEYLKDEVPDIKRPQAVMYEPMPDGKMELVAVEYITSKGPASLEGQLFSFTGAPNRYGLGPFYELHVWAWKPNPRYIRGHEPERDLRARAREVTRLASGWLCDGRWRRRREGRSPAHVETTGSARVAVSNTQSARFR
jgi:hypothetical protein